MKRYNFVAFLMAVMLLFMGLGTESASASSSAKITSSKGAVIKVAGGTGYAVTAKRLKAGTKVSLKALGKGSKYAKTVAYGKAKGWSGARIAKALKKPKNYKANTKGFIFYKAVKGRSVYVVAVRTKTKTAAATPKPVMAKLTVQLSSSQPEYTADVYALEGTLMCLKGEDGSHAVSAGPDGSASLDVPPGTYELWFPRESRELACGQTPYRFEKQTITVMDSSMTAEIVLDPVPGWLFIELTPETAEQDIDEVLLDGSPVDAPSDQAVPAGMHLLSVVLADGQTIGQEVDVVPGAPTGVEL